MKTPKVLSMEKSSFFYEKNQFAKRYRIAKICHFCEKVQFLERLLNQNNVKKRQKKGVFWLFSGEGEEGGKKKPVFCHFPRFFAVFYDPLCVFHIFTKSYLLCIFQKCPKFYHPIFGYIFIFCLVGSIYKKTPAQFLPKLLISIFHIKVLACQ